MDYLKAPTPDWNGTYSLLEDQTKRIYDLVKANSKEMNIQNLYSEGLPVDMKNYSTDVELVVYERGGLSPETVQAVNGIEGDEVVLNWLRDNPREDWSALSDNIKPIPRKRPVDGKLRVAFVFGEHSRELVSTEMGEFFLKVLAESSTETLLPLLNGDSKLVKEVLEALDNTVIHAVPCENKNGRRIVETKDEDDKNVYHIPQELLDTGRRKPPNQCQRANSRFIDPNRNWPAKWGNKPYDYQPWQEYPGPEPLSEPESRLMPRSAPQQCKSISTRLAGHGSKALAQRATRVGTKPLRGCTCKKHALPHLALPHAGRSAPCYDAAPHAQDERSPVHALRPARLQ